MARRARPAPACRARARSADRRRRPRRPSGRWSPAPRRAPRRRPARRGARPCRSTTTYVCAFVGSEPSRTSAAGGTIRLSGTSRTFTSARANRPATSSGLPGNADDDLERAAARIDQRRDAVHLAFGDEAGQRIDGHDDGLAHLHLAEIARRRPTRGTRTPSRRRS